MKPINEITKKQCSDLSAIFFDIDDTFSTDGIITNDAYNALWRAKEANLALVPITGRPGGWVDHIARMWPVDAVIGENGAFYFWMENNKMQRFYLQSSQERKNNRQKLDQIAQKILAEVPGCAIAADQAYREIDLAIDFAEDVPALQKNEINQILAIFKEYGAEAKVSSIHVNGWFGNFDKFSTMRLFCEKMWRQDFATHKNQYLFLGDSPNDEPMFANFSLSIGVNNVLDFKEYFTALPVFITNKRSGHGFAEAIDIVLQKRQILYG